ncbi:hypothetical protein J7J18_04420 [bacterium]|nr:hypothetical protein [bacterium]
MKISELLIIVLIGLGILTGTLNFYVNLYTENNSTTNVSYLEKYTVKNESGSLFKELSDYSTNVSKTADTGVKSLTSKILTTIATPFIAIKNVISSIFKVPNLLHDMITNVVGKTPFVPSWLGYLVFAVLMTFITFQIVNFIRGGHKI